MAKSYLQPQVSRRALLAGLAGAAALAASPIMLHAAPTGADAVFRHGVASGDPDGSSVVLWTRVTADGEPEVTWELAETSDFSRPLKRGSLRTGPDQDHTVKVLAEGLSPGRTYFYRFRTAGALSPVGRARTLPEGRLDRLGIALAACSNYAFGYFNAYDAIARDPAVDFVLHTGDYIYEYGAASWGGEVARSIGRVHQPANDLVTLADYRQRHAQYKTDRGSQAMHAARTLLACWDDHESANNSWKGGAEHHDPATEGPWQTRRDASIRAYYEWMPVREPAAGHTRPQFWRCYRFGDLAMLHTLETRHTARAEQIDYLHHAANLTSPEAVAKFRNDVLGAPERRMISAELEASLSAELGRSLREKQPWRLIGSPSVIARTDVPDVVALGLLADPMPKLAGAGPAQLAAAAKDPAISLAWRGRLNLPFFTDPWDGYPWARERLYDLSRAAGAGDLIFLSGDSHSFWINSVVDDARRPAGLEFGTAGISSPGDFMDSGFGADLSRKLDRAVADHNPEVRWTDNMHQGYVRLELGRETGSATFVAVSTVLSTDYTAAPIKTAHFRRREQAIELTDSA